MAKVHVVKIPRVSEPLCWKQGPLALGQPHCDRRKHGKRVAHTWEMETELRILRSRRAAAVESAYREACVTTARMHLAHSVTKTRIEEAWLASEAKAALGPK